MSDMLIAPEILKSETHRTLARNVEVRCSTPVADDDYFPHELGLWLDAMQPGDVILRGLAFVRGQLTVVYGYSNRGEEPRCWIKCWMPAGVSAGAF